MVRMIFNAVACATTLTALSISRGGATMRQQSLPCNYVCTSQCPTGPEQQRLCAALGADCQWIPYCPEESTNCPTNYETPCFSFTP